MKVEECHSHGTVHIPMSCNLQEVARQMAAQHVGALIVTDLGRQNHIVGIVTDRDIVLGAVATGRSPGETMVGELMTQGVVTVDEAADVSTAMQTMMSQGVRRLAVLRGGSEIVGVLSLDDVIDALGRDWSMLTAILRSEQNRERTGSVQTPLHA
ncbi:CBS domain-containing protein [Paraburkholderia sacchari]|uniref:CBS domain-containing protein n=1 Tax=Paraburkholderia sacchari TaxID=159450 RepID=UPI000542075C|nr:CBS domain-containing protein [Paraburkholderia sacchari]NLP64740.1 CBS domain-containing protein [Paraburkholderia sacchari]